MQQNATEDSLTPGQERAIGGLLGGKTITDAAADAGVDRGTIHRWLKDDFGFQAALNAGRRELRRATYCRLESIALKAADCVERAIDGGDVKAALEVLKGLRVLAPIEIESDEAGELADKAARAKAEAAVEAERAKVELSERKENLLMRSMAARW